MRPHLDRRLLRREQTNAKAAVSQASDDPAHVGNGSTDRVTLAEPDHHHRIPIVKRGGRRPCGRPGGSGPHELTTDRNGSHGELSRDPYDPRGQMARSKFDRAANRVIHKKATPNW